MTGNYAKAQQTVFARAQANGLAALGQWGRRASRAIRQQLRCAERPIATPGLGAGVFR